MKTDTHRTHAAFSRPFSIMPGYKDSKLKIVEHKG